MRLLFTALACLFFYNSTISQTIVRGDSKIIFESKKVKLIEKKALDVVFFNSRVRDDSTYIVWSWDFQLFSPGSMFYPTEIHTKEASFTMKNVKESINLMQECIKILEMEEDLGSHDKIVHNYGGVQMIRFGSNPTLVELHPTSGGSPLTGKAYNNGELSLTEKECYFFIQKLKNHRPLLGK